MWFNLRTWLISPTDACPLTSNLLVIELNFGDFRVFLRATSRHNCHIGSLEDNWEGRHLHENMAMFGLGIGFSHNIPWDYDMAFPVDTVPQSLIVQQSSLIPSI